MVKEKIKIAYCGALGSFGREIAARLFPDGELVGCVSFKEAYERVSRRECDKCVLPLENSYAGEVAAVVDIIYRGELYIADIDNMRIVQNLIGLPEATPEKVRTVTSHPQALMQCEEYITAHGYDTLPTENTAFAAKSVAEKGDVTLAAIAAADCAEIYGLKVLARDIATAEENATRFAVLQGEEPAPRAGESTVLYFSLKDTSGALANALQIIAKHGYNLQALHSRPAHTSAWHYYFYAEAEGMIRGEDKQSLCNDMRELCETIKTAGYYLPDKRI